jgi:hypothetical protein
MTYKFLNLNFMMNTAKLAAGFFTLSLIAACGGGGSAGPTSGDAASSSSTTSGGSSTSTASGGGSTSIASGGGSTSTASGSGSTSTASGSGSDSTTSISGVAFDGYLFNALVCLDLNNNLGCDDNEPQTFTDINGKFKLENVSSEMSKSHSIVVRAIADKTIDSDKPNEKIKNGYTLTAPAGITTVSPLTTLLKSYMVSNNVGAEDAAREIQRVFSAVDNTNLVMGKFILDNFMKDYIEKKDATLTKIGVALRRLAEKFPTLNLTEFRKSFAEIIPPNVNEILLASNIDMVLSNVDIAEFNNIASQDGIYEFRSLGGNWFRVRSTKLDLPKTFTFTNYLAINQPRFVGQPDTAREYWELMSTGWSSVSGSISKGITTVDLVGGPYGNSGVKVAVEGSTLEGKNFDFTAVNRSSIILPTGSRGFKLSFTSPADRFILSSPRLAGPFQEQLTSLNELVATYPSSAQASYVNFVRSSTGLLMTFTPTAASAGTLTFRNPDVPGQVLLSGGSYLIGTVSGRQMLYISEIPEAALLAVANDNPTALHDYKNGIRPFFAVGPNGGVFEGVHTPKGTITNPMVQYNQTALNAILKALSLCQFKEKTLEMVNCP